MWTDREHLMSSLSYSTCLVILENLVSYNTYQDDENNRRLKRLELLQQVQILTDCITKI